MMGVTHQQLMQITPIHLSRMSDIQRNNLASYYLKNIDLIGRQLCYKKMEQFRQDQKRRLVNRNGVDHDRFFDMVISGQIRPIITFDYEARLQRLIQLNRKHRESYRQWELGFREFRKTLKQIRERCKVPEEPTLYESIAAFISSIISDKPQLPKGMYSLQNVQKERNQRSKPPKKGFFIRSRNPKNRSLNEILKQQ